MSPAFAFPDGPVVAWYGDDFTGSASVLEVLEFNGVPSVLFLALPDTALLARFPARRGIGIAGDARAQSPDWMRAALPPVFAALRATGARIVHYKVCSTFDSAPARGSIGCAAEVANADCAPMVIATPRIGRWQAFGTLFARSPAGVARLDRHPTMSVHPATPMHEADVRRHLAHQTARAVGLVDLTDLKTGHGPAAFARERKAGARIVAFDVIDDETLLETGRTLWEQAQQSQLFMIGSQGVEDALVAAWSAAGHHNPPPPVAKAAGRVAVISGSCAPETAAQIATAIAAGFTGLRIDVTAALDPALWHAEAARIESAALEVLSRGASPILFTATGPDDPVVALTTAARARAGMDETAANAALGRALGNLLARLVAHTGLRRVAIAGGDTSSHATAALGVMALTANAAFAPAVPLLHGHYADASRPPLELVLKGGQMGAPDMFIALRDGPKGAA
jgi:3-oxoisoapionate kinase